MFSELTQLNESHQLLRQLTQQLRRCHDHDVSTTYARLLDWMEQVFGTEQQMMEKHEFPAARSHLEQHARVLCAMHKAHPAVMRGDHELGRHIGATLMPGWFELHNATLDAALVVWTCCHISPSPHDFNRANAWVGPDINDHPRGPSSVLWRGPERRTQTRL